MMKRLQIYNVHRSRVTYICLFRRVQVDLGQLPDARPNGNKQTESLPYYLGAVERVCRVAEYRGELL